MAVAGVELDFTKVTMSIIVAMLLWVGNTVYRNSVQIAVLVEKVESVTVDRFTGRDALLLEQRITTLERTVAQLMENKR